MLWNLDPFEPLVSQLSRTPAFIPAADVSVSDGDLVLTMDVPGLTQDDLSIEMQHGDLVVRGERKRPELPHGASLAHEERAYGKFERRIKLPEGVDAEAVTADLDNGVLSLTVPKGEHMKPKTITIATGTEKRQLETSAS